MKKFKFRLEKIRKFKQQVEQDKKGKLAEKQILCQIEKDRLAAIVSTRQKYLSGYGIRKPGKVNIRELIISRRYIDKLASDITSQTATVTSVKHLVTKAQKDLIEASREKKKYEKLKQRRKHIYLKELARIENQELDEFGARQTQSSLSKTAWD